MKLYHGSYTIVDAPEVKRGRNKVDFGRGFYLTSISKQAEQWAKVISIRRGPLTKPTVSVFSFDESVLTSRLYRIKLFPEYNLEWLDYVVDCRNNGTEQDNYDLVEGGVANDNVIDTVEDYENGRITAEQALDQLRYKKVNHQICIRNQEIVNSFLSFDGAYDVNKKEGSK